MHQESKEASSESGQGCVVGSTQNRRQQAVLSNARTMAAHVLREAITSPKPISAEIERSTFYNMVSTFDDCFVPNIQGLARRTPKYITGEITSQDDLLG